MQRDVIRRCHRACGELAGDRLEAIEIVDLRNVPQLDFRQAQTGLAGLVQLAEREFRAGGCVHPTGCARRVLDGCVGLGGVIVVGEALICELALR